MKKNKFIDNFIQDVLEKESWYREMRQAKKIDLLLLTGSVARNIKDDYSDVDLFLVCSTENQKKYSLKPIYEFFYQEKKVEISMVSSEKIILDAKNKTNYYWWWKNIVIRSYNKKTLYFFQEASKITKKELMDKLWTNFVRFKINSEDITKLLKRDEYLSCVILFSDNVKLLSEAFLINLGVHVQSKRLGMSLKECDAGFYSKILNLSSAKDKKSIIKNNYKLEKYFEDILENNKFKATQISNWEECNLERIIFQRS